jgi:hypothetical protein
MNGGENRRGRLPKWALGAVSQKPPHLLARILWVLGQALITAMTSLIDDLIDAIDDKTP